MAMAALSSLFQKAFGMDIDEEEILEKKDNYKSATEQKQILREEEDKALV